MGNGGADIVDQLLFNKLLAVPDTVKHFSNRNRRDRVLTDQTEAGLVFRRRRIFHPEHTECFNALTESRRLNRGQTVVHVVQKMLIKAKFTAHRIEQLRCEIEVFFGGPELLFRPVTFSGGLVGQPFSFRHAIGGFHTRHAALDADRLKAHLFVTGVIFQHVINGVSGGMTIDHHPFPGCAAQQLVERHIGRFGFDIPQCHIHGGNGRHGDRTTTPVGAFIEELPDILNAVRITADQLRAEVIFQIRGHRKFTSVEGGITQADDALVGGNLKGDKVTPRAGNKDFSPDNLHNPFPYIAHCDAGNLLFCTTTIQV